MKDLGIQIRIVLFAAIGVFGVTGCVIHEYILLSMVAATWGFFACGYCVGVYMAAPEPKARKTRKA